MSEGLKLQFKEKPVLSINPPANKVISGKTAWNLEDFIPNWLDTGVIREITIPIPLHFSILFMRLKKNGKKRPIIDLSELNKMLYFPSFKMETVAVISNTITGELWACSIDIKDAYFHVPINWEFHKFLAFKVKNRVFVFQFLPFGLSPAPWAFTRVIRPVKKRLHSVGQIIFSFIDDFILFAKSPEELSKAAEAALDLLQKLGFSINWEKSNLVPSQNVEFLGVDWDLKDRTLSVPLEKRQEIVRRCTMALNRDCMTRREMECLVGKMNFASAYIQLGRMHLLPLLAWMNLRSSAFSRDRPVQLDAQFKKRLMPWLDWEFLGRAVSLEQVPPSQTLMTDASLDGWCGVLLPHKTVGSWSQDMIHHSMNWKELMRCSCPCGASGLCWWGKASECSRTAQQQSVV